MINVKSAYELDIMKRAGEIVALAHIKLKSIIEPGITTQELDRIIEEHIRKHSAIPSFKGYKSFTGGVDYPSSICASINEEVIHGIPGLRPLKNGDIISIDIGACYNGFHGDAARTYSVGTVSNEAIQLIDVTEKSFFKGLSNVVPGKRISDISREIQKCVEGYGYSIVRDFVGHGIGREMHEAPQIPNFVSRERGPRLQKGMTLAIEPMVNQGDYKVKMLDNLWTVVTKDGKLSAHYENTVAVTNDEPVILTLL